MVKKISIVRYKKLVDVDFDFTAGINIISGSNGTCKTSLLHIVSNSFQAVNRSYPQLVDARCLPIINGVNSLTNPKIESLSRGDKQHNDPADGNSGKIFQVEYMNREPLSFRKHNSGKYNRYAVKPFYKPGTHDSLPYCPVVYLGLTRLFPFGEFLNDDAVEKIKKSLPDDYQCEIARLYQNFTHVSITSTTAVPQKMGDIRVRTDFSSETKGIDSNTISAGEDNLYMLLTALMSLKYFYNSIASQNECESILLVDEFDATLHPSYQMKLLDLCRSFSRDYKIQMIFTTHSLPLIEYALSKKDHVIYLVDNVNSVVVMDSPDAYKIKMHLHDVTSDEMYLSKKIPVFTEDAEARFFLQQLFDFLSERHSDFMPITQLFHFVDANVSAQTLKNIFSDEYLIRSTMRAICILDGDMRSDLSNYTIALPGGASPEDFLFRYAIELLDNDDPFWVSSVAIEMNYGKSHFLSTIKPDIDGISEKLRELESRGESTHGIKREENKKVFNKHKRFFLLILGHWMRNDENSGQIQKFYKELYAMYRKTAEFHGINPALWHMQ